MKKDKIEKEQELLEAIEDKEKLERKHQIELKRYKEKNTNLEDENNKLISDYEILKKKFDEYSPKILEYKDLYDKFKRLEKENKNLKDGLNMLFLIKIFLIKQILLMKYYL